MPFGKALSLFKNARDRTSLRQQITFLAVSFCILSASAATIGAYVVARNESLRESRWDLTLIARNLTQRLDQTVFERHREIGSVSNRVVMRSKWTTDTATVRATLDQLQNSVSQYAWIGFIAPDGTVLAATEGLLEGTSVSGRAWFVNALEASPSTMVDEFPTKLGNHSPHIPTKTPLNRFVVTASPIRSDDGEVIGVLGARLNWSWAKHALHEVLEGNTGEDALELLVFDKNNMFLFGSVPGGAPRFDSSDTNMLTAVVATAGQSDFPGLGWKVVARQPRSVVSVTLTGLLFHIFLVGLGVSLLAALFAWLISRSVSRPLIGLIEALDGIGRADGDNNVARQHGSREILQLSASIRSLLRRIDSAEEVQRDSTSKFQQMQGLISKQLRMSEERNRQLGADIVNLKTLAELDPLSGLQNRRAFQPFAEDAWAAFRRHKRAYSILMIDADYFKMVNDRFGHRAGDDVIRQIGRVISGEVRATDKAARYGGEEFIVLLRENDAGGALVLAERIRKRVEDLSIPFAGEEISITVSIGVAQVLAEDRDFEDTIARADRALYSAKSSGRNQVSIDDPVSKIQSA
ncbi:sensor domain-containing diguanylate cyclase [Roseibium sediminicola]|uniref:diguanylate cyclase n=1 Tax=Roseibium sediminicola TaxID=2933272 RepID=A0ABT0GW46_9HYPH|nr:sensor domain-containing diguanylate cyclase [Roseibium sp. CAU 1639]MCK7613672.1 diguanylate cyclase [Roseibium sp. CAU 1639]